MVGLELKPNDMVVKLRQCLVKMTSFCDSASKCIQGLLEAYSKTKVNGEQEKVSIMSVRMG